MVFGVILFGATAALMAGVAVWVLLARPGATVNRLLAAYLLLSAASVLVFRLIRIHNGPVERIPYMRTIYWYEIPTLILLPFILHALFPPLRRPRLRAPILAGTTALGLVFLVGLVFTPHLYFGEPARGWLPPEPLAAFYGAIYHGLHAAAVLVAAYVAGSSERSRIERKQAALVGIAFATLVGQGAGYRVVASIDNYVQLGITLPAPFQAPTAVAMLLGFVVVAVSVRRLRDPFEGDARRWATFGAFAGIAFGTFDRVVMIPAAILGVPSWGSARPLAIAGFAAIMSVAVVRFGLAGIAPGSRERIERTTAQALVVMLSLGAALAALLTIGFTPAGLLLAAVGAATPPVLLLAVAPTVRAVGARLVASPADPDLVEARARAYASALRAEGAHGAPAERGEARLRKLREELGLTERDHAVLAALVPRGDAGPLLLGRYRLDERLAQADATSVHRATDLLTGRVVVIKQARDALGAAMLFAEARALARISHERVVRLLHVEAVTDAVYAVLEHAPGGSLAKRLREGGPLDPPEAAQVVADVASAVAAVHDAGFAHGDVKAENVLLDAGGRWILADFGTARALMVAPDATAPVVPAASTPSTMAPEQARGEPAGRAADVYALGALAYRTLTGEHYLPLAGLAPAEIARRVVSTEPRLPHPRVPAGVETVLRRALRKAAHERQPDARAFLDDWEAAIGRSSGLERPA